MAAMTLVGRIKQAAIVLFFVVVPVWAQVPLPQKAAPVAPRPVTPKPAEANLPVTGSVTIPGPMRSFLRMAGISQKAEAAEVMPLLAHRVYLNGYQGKQPTEFLLLLERYLRQARELQVMAGSKSVIHVQDCSAAGPLLKVLGYKLEHGCGSPDAALETAESERAFLTVDSGFPLSDLEEALQKNQPFDYPYASTTLPILFTEKEWLALNEGGKTRSSNGVDLVIADEAVARLYWAMNSMDRETARYLRQTIGLRRMLPFAPEFDFYGSQLHVRNGAVQVPGGTNAEAAWKELVGASPQSAATFIGRLYSKDDGWLAAYFDVLSRVDGEQQRHLTAKERLIGDYNAFRTVDRKEKAGIGSFRRASELLVLFSRVRWDQDGAPHVPGSLAIWNTIVDEGSDEKPVRERVRNGRTFATPGALLEALTASSREETETGPLQLYLMLSEMDRRRPAASQLTPAAVSFLARHFETYNDWYLIFGEFPALDQESMELFVNVAQGLDALKNSTLKANAIGSMQAEVTLWQILARQHEIPEANLNASWRATVSPFMNLTSPTQLFDASVQGLKSLEHAAGAADDAAPSTIVELLAGPAQSSPEGQRVHARLVAKIQSVLEDQQLASLDTLVSLGDGLEKMTNGGKGSDDLVAMAAELRGFELPRPIFTRSEKVSWAPQVYTNRHSELQVQTDLTKVIKTNGSKAQVETARGQLAAFLRDTLVGLCYAYYEPPGAQILHINPLFVRAHDFLGISMIGARDIWHAPRLVGAGVAAGGGAYLMGSMADLPFSLASAEQDFIVPENIQALIWREVVPDLITGSTVPRWWNVSPRELHAVALYQRAGEEIFTAAVNDTALHGEVSRILASHLSPARMEEAESALQSQAGVRAYLPRMMPSDKLYLAEMYRTDHANEAAAIGPASKELAALMTDATNELNATAISDDFGVPHPTLARSSAPEILGVEPFPASAGSTNRIFGESIESINLYWARLADELGYSPRMLNVLAPEMTRVMVGKIFASDVEDWPALVRAMQEAGQDLRDGKVSALPSATAINAAQQTADVQDSGQEKP